MFGENMVQIIHKPNIVVNAEVPVLERVEKNTVNTVMIKKYKAYEK